MAVLRGGQRANLESVQALRGFAALCVVFFHAHQFELDARYFGYAPMGGFWTWGLHGIDLFFVISGFVMAHVHWDDFLRGGGWRRFAVSRVTRIYVPYWPVLIVLAYVYFAMPALGREALGNVRDPVTILRSFLLWPGTHGLLPVAWTLQHEVVFYALVMIALIRRVLGTVLFVMWQVYAVVAAATAPADSDSAKLWMGPYEIQFALGIACFLVLRRFPAMRYARTVLGAGLAAFFAIALYTTFVSDFQPMSFASTLSYGLAASAILVGAVSCERAGYLPVPRLAAMLGAASYAIYLIHFPFISLMMRLLARFGVHDPMSAVPVLLELVVMSVAAGCLYHFLVERPLIAGARNLLKRLGGALALYSRLRRAASASPTSRSAISHSASALTGSSE